MSRVITAENVTLVREFLAPVTTIRWEPLTNTGTLTYQVEEFLFVDGKFSHSKSVGESTITLDNLVNNTYSVEVAPNQFVDIQGGLIMLAFKKAFEQAIENGLVSLGTVTPAPADPIPDGPAGEVVP
jgi:hypothetical protein